MQLELPAERFRELAKRVAIAAPVDEIRLVVFPVVVGAGQRLFGEHGGRNPLRLVDTHTMGEGLVSVTYASARDRTT